MTANKLNKNLPKTTNQFSVKKINDSGIGSDITHTCLSENSSTSSGVKNLHKNLHKNSKSINISKYKLRTTKPKKHSSSSSSTKLDKKDFLWHAEEKIAYEKVRLIGKGGFSTVYQVQSTITGEVFAAKVIGKKHLSNANKKARVRNEIEIHSAVSGHPNILDFRGSFKSGENVCILTKICLKHSLLGYMNKCEQLSEDKISIKLVQIVRGLQHLHGMGVIHRDLKPANIMQTQNNQIKIGDFGLATLVDHIDKNTICGTPYFIAPEVLNKQGHSFKSDIWALGCIFYVLLTCQYPFYADTIKETYRQIVKGVYKVPIYVSKVARNLLSWLLNINAKKRPSLDEILRHPYFKKVKISKNFLLNYSDVEKKNPNSFDKLPVVTRIYKKVKEITGFNQTKSDSFSLRNSSNKNSIENHNQVFITNWVDFSNRYGFGYQLSDGKICVLFNDGKHLSLIPNSNKMEYCPANYCKNGIQFYLNQYPSRLRRYIQSFFKIAEYMRIVKPLQNEKMTNSTCSKVRLVSWTRDENCLSMYLSNENLQCKFFKDGRKVLFKNIHNKYEISFSVLNKKTTKEYTTFLSNHLGQNEEGNTLQVVHNHFHNKFFNVECEKDCHPFCKFLENI